MQPIAALLLRKQEPFTQKKLCILAVLILKSPGVILMIRATSITAR